MSRTQHHLVAVGSRCFLHKHWPTLQWHTKTHKRLTQRLAMGASVWSMQRVTQALQTLAARARLQRKIHRAAMVAAQRTRSRLIHESILLWHHHAEGAWQQGSRAERADRQWKRHCFHQFRRGVQHLASAAASSSIIAVLENRASTFRNISNNFQPVLSTELHSSRSNNSSPAKTSKSRWVVFRGRLFRRRRALVRLWKHAVRVALQQRGAVAWGVKW